MRVLLTLVLLALASPAAAQQCPSSALRVEIVSGNIGGCVTATPAENEPELNVTNNCDEDQFNLAPGVDCPNCGPPLTLRAGNFGSFIVDTRPLTQFEPTSPAEDHVLDWALGNSTGTLTVRVVPDITICPVPDMGMPDTSTIDEAEPDPIPEGKGGCSVSQKSPPSTHLLPALALLAFLFAAPDKRRRKHQQ